MPLAVQFTLHALVLADPAGLAAYPRLWSTIAQQGLCALRAVHAVGFVHSDVNPNNLLLDIRPDSAAAAVSVSVSASAAPSSHEPPALSFSFPALSALLPDQLHVSLCDFGLCYPRAVLAEPLFAPKCFNGTVQYAPLTAHHRKAQSYIDDVQALGFVLWALYTGGRLPWSELTDEAEVGRTKESALQLSLAPRPLQPYFRYCDELPPYQQPGWPHRSLSRY